MPDTEGADQLFRDAANSDAESLLRPSGSAWSAPFARPGLPPCPSLAAWRRRHGRYACLALAGLALVAAAAVLRRPSRGESPAPAGEVRAATELDDPTAPSPSGKHAPAPAPGGRWVFQPLDEDGNPTCDCACSDLWTTMTKTTTTLTTTDTTTVTTTVTETSTTRTSTTRTSTTETSRTSTTRTTTSETTTTATSRTTLTATTVTTTPDALFLDVERMIGSHSGKATPSKAGEHPTHSGKAKPSKAGEHPAAATHSGGRAEDDGAEAENKGQTAGHARTQAGHARTPAGRAHTPASKYPPAERCLELPERLLYCRSEGGNRWPLCMGIKDGDTAEGLAEGVIELQDCGAGDASHYEQFVLNHTDSQIHWFPDPSKCLEVENRNGEVPEGARLKLADCQEPCEVMRDPTRQGFCVDITRGAQKVIKSSCYGETSDKNPAEFDRNRETAQTKCVEVAGGALRGAPVAVGSCKEQEFSGGSQCWLYIDLYRKCPACDRKKVPAFLNLTGNVLPSGGTDCMADNFPGGCSANGFEGCGRSCCCDGHQWSCERDSFTCGCWRPLLECS